MTRALSRHRLILALARAAYNVSLLVVEYRMAILGGSNLRGTLGKSLSIPRKSVAFTLAAAAKTFLKTARFALEKMGPHLVVRFLMLARFLDASLILASRVIRVVQVVSPFLILYLLVDCAGAGFTGDAFGGCLEYEQGTCASQC